MQENREDRKQTLWTGVNRKDSHAPITIIIAIVVVSMMVPVPPVFVTVVASNSYVWHHSVWPHPLVTRFT